MPPTTLILRTAGTNCDRELACAFEQAGSRAELVHLNRLIAEPTRLDRFDLLGLPGGFSYGDDISAGRILANRLRHRLGPALRRFVAAGKPIIGICNGFQVLIKTGLLPDFDPADDRPMTQTATLSDNTLPRFVDRWVGLRAEPHSHCVWTAGLDQFALCIAHGEGRFLADDATLDRLEAAGQVTLRYVDNPNGSMRDIAGVCDRTGLVFGLMPHPERDVDRTHEPTWTRRMAAATEAAAAAPAGLTMFANAVERAAARRARWAKAGIARPSGA